MKQNINPKFKNYSFYTPNNELAQGFYKRGKIIIDLSNIYAENIFGAIKELHERVLVFNGHVAEYNLVTGHVLVVPLYLDKRVELTIKI